MFGLFKTATPIKPPMDPMPGEVILKGKALPPGVTQEPGYQTTYLYKGFAIVVGEDFRLSISSDLVDGNIDYASLPDAMKQIDLISVWR